MTITTSRAIAKRVSAVTGADERILIRTIIAMDKEWKWGSHKIYTHLVKTLGK